MNNERNGGGGGGLYYICNEKGEWMNLMREGEEEENEEGERRRVFENIRITWLISSFLLSSSSPYGPSSLCQFE